MPHSAVTVKDVPADKFIKAYAQHLRKSGKVKVPEWVEYVKTGSFKELAPYDRNWYYVRTASIARKVYLRPGTGVGALNKVYGGSKRNGVRPSHFCTASGAVTRSCLANLEALKVIEKDSKSGGRRTTATGQRDLDRIAGRIKAQQE